MNPDEIPAAPVPDHAQMVELNEALVIAGLHQQELAEAAEILNAKLRATIADRVLMADDLAQLARSKDEFLAMLAHELRNPLASVAHAVTLLKEVNCLSGPEGSSAPAVKSPKEEEDAAEIRRWATEVIDRQSRQLSRLVEDLLDVARITQGKVTLRCARIDLADVLASAGDTVAPLIALRDHTLLCEFPRGELWLEADATRVEQIVVNLLTNAAKYTELRGRIILQACREAAEVVITVRDSGVGIAPERIPEMFVLFAQGDRSLARSEGGLGIGLTIVQGLCELHGGSVSAHSRGPGTGSTFTVRLPAADPPLSAPARNQARPPVANEGTGVRVLVVDDNTDAAAGLGRLLQRRGYTVALAHDGITALEMAHRSPPAVVLLDVGLPGMDGYAVTRRLRADARFAGILIIAITGYGQDEDRAHSIEAGCDHHLTKPVDFEDLRALLHQHLHPG